LSSILRAADAVTPAPTFTFIVDGPFPADLLRVMADRGEIVRTDAGSTRRSYRRAITEGVRTAGRPDDLVWFAEDDYLYQPNALTTLASAATAMPGAHYFMLSGSNALDRSVPGRSANRLRSLPGAQGDSSSRILCGVRWFRGESTTSTFAVRLRVLRDDARLLRFMPLTGGAWDRATCMAYQGFRPFRAREILPLSGEPVHRWPRLAVRGLFRAAAMVRSHRRPSHRRVLAGADPELILHMEVPTEDTRGPLSAESAKTDWETVAADTLRASAHLTRADIGVWAT
jgi:hypothetical protein